MAVPINYQLSTTYSGREVQSLCFHTPPVRPDAVEVTTPLSYNLTQRDIGLEALHCQDFDDDSTYSFFCLPFVRRFHPSFLVFSSCILDTDDTPQFKLFTAVRAGGGRRNLRRERDGHRVRAVRGSGQCLTPRTAWRQYRRAWSGDLWGSRRFRPTRPQYARP